MLFDKGHIKLKEGKAISLPPRSPSPPRYFKVSTKNYRKYRGLLKRRGDAGGVEEEEG